MEFADRRDAGRRLAARLVRLAAERPVVVGLPRGGVPVAHEVALALAAPLDVLIVRKIGCPGQPELGLGALGEDGIVLLNEPLLQAAGVSQAAVADVIRRETAELERRVERYRQGRAPVDLAGRTVIVVDDGLATGFTARAGIEIVRRRGATRVVLAVPVAPEDAVRELASVADEVVCVLAPRTFWAIGEFYVDFSQTEDVEVTDLLATPTSATLRAS